MKHLFLFAALLVVTTLHAQQAAPAWESAVTLGQRPLTGDLPRTLVGKTVPDGQGNLYVTGYYTGTITFGPTTLTSTQVPGYPAGSGYSDDIFVAKYSLSTHRYLWAIGAGSLGTESASELVVSGPNIYIAGNTSGHPGQAGTLTFGSTALTTTGHLDIFVAKLTDTGSGGAWQWAKLGASTYFTDVTGLAVSGSSVYLAGDFTDAIRFDNTTLSTAATAASNSGDLLLVKLRDAGTSATVAWAQTLGTNASESATAFVASGTSLYLAGSYSGTSAVGSIALPNTGTRGQDTFVAKLTDTGTGAVPVWAQHIGGTSSDYVRALSLAGNTLYVAGNFYSPSLTFGTGPTLANSDATGTTSNLFLARLTDAGSTSSFTWAQQTGSSSDLTASQLLRVGNALYLAGTYSGTTATFGPTVFANPEYSDRDAFVLRLNETSTGATLAWAQSIASPSYDSVYALYLLGSRLYVQGYADGAATFGATTLPLYSSYLAALNPDAPLATAVPSALPSLALYPTPAHGRVTVLLPAVPGTTEAQLHLYDALGHLVHSSTQPHPPTGLRYELSLANLPAGVYWLRVQAGSASATRQLVVE